MKIKLRPSLLKVRRQSVKWIIIHHTSELYHDPASKIDNPKFQMPGIVKGVHEQKTGDINYHYIIDKIKEDYWPIACRPIAYLCDFPDIHPDIAKRSINVAVMGNYSFKVAETRLYEILAFRLLNPMLKLFNISPSKIKLHRDVSDIEDLDCPGNFFDRGKLESLVRRYVIK